MRRFQSAWPGDTSGMRATVKPCWLSPLKALRIAPKPKTSTPVHAYTGCQAVLRDACPPALRRKWPRSPRRFGQGFPLVPWWPCGRISRKRWVGFERGPTRGPSVESLNLPRTRTRA